VVHVGISSVDKLRHQPCHLARVSNGPTEAANNLIKRMKGITRVGFGFTGYRIGVLLYAGKPNWDLLATVTPR
jgi:transposase